MAQSGLATLGFGRDVFEPEHDAFRETMRRFIQREVEPNVRRWEEEGFFPADLFRKAGEAGVLCAGIPAEYGGMGGDVRHHIVMNEELAYSPLAAALEGSLSIDFSSYAILNDGTEEQRREWLPRFARGETIAEIALSEPGAGSDAGAIKTSARRDGGDYIINGQKSWITNGPILTMALVVCRTKTEGDTDGYSMFLVPTDTPGVTIRETDLMMKSCGGVAEMFLEDVRIPAGNLLGGVEGNGLRSALKLIGLGRVMMASKAIAACEAALEITRDYVHTRRAFGQAIDQFQNTQFKLASISTEIAAGRALADQSIRRYAEGRLSVADGARAKLFCTEVEGRVMDECLQLHGGAGFTNEYPISKMYLLARAHRIYGGTSEIMRDIIYRSM
ncbi:acyl-CoA dehydrogenase family protein [Rhizorhabdus dicambivorans]|uniref:Medium-chain specific acyl-CoA dehydrogenase, mitochondrial n=1 Tax=Rhizorhabdus dicambivorans TaxID=1850238 RepID=A0A2A4FSU7_9SPHN|nr:acyl-CoA dehydrogenase family protein [Rhizorhabdus dicambivorans]ATE64642.1 acyl-CoA dehydrogenase [Rhizorhabdus dicambivorans]PCE40764.1 acyl-CoA dehydrogenase [Rhizorhabdus dicambivorans]